MKQSLILGLALAAALSLPVLAAEPGGQATPAHPHRAASPLRSPRLRAGFGEAGSNRTLAGFRTQHNPISRASGTGSEAGAGIDAEDVFDNSSPHGLGAGYGPRRVVSGHALSPANYGDIRHRAVA